MAASVQYQQLDQELCDVEIITCPICQRLYTDARDLSCGHSFCFSCLKELQSSSSSKPCAVCQEPTVPVMEELIKLEPNSELNTKVGIAMLRKVKEEEGAKERGGPHFAAECDHCKSESFLGARFKCCTCENYDLCEKCEAKPREEVHDKTHLFMKLRNPQTKLVGHDGGPLKHTFMQKMEEQTKTLDDREADSKSLLNCNNCSREGIDEVLYRCGICEEYNLCGDCEVSSRSFHSDKHPFIKIPTDHPAVRALGKERLVKDDYYK